MTYLRNFCALVALFVLPLAAQQSGYDTIPDHWKAPFGPYQQAPANCGGKWFYISPFNSSNGNAPWLRFCTDFVPPNQRDLPDGFEDIFGPEPVRREGETFFEFRPRRERWEQFLKHFKAAGLPQEFPAAVAVQAIDVYKFWGIEAPKFYVGRYGAMAYFRFLDREMGAHSVVFFPGHIVASIQIDEIANGNIPDKIHPFVPRSLFEEDED